MKKTYNHRDALLSKLAQVADEVNAAEKLADLAMGRLDEARSIERKIREELEGLNIVQVAYLGGQDVTPLKSRASFDYIDGTFEGLRVGDIVVAPTVYNKRARGIVVQVGGPRTYWGPLKSITEVLFP